MSRKDGRDFLYLIWKDPVERRQYIVAQLSKNGQFEFEYGIEVEAAIEHGFKPLISFENIDQTYKNDVLFPVFSSRLPDRKRRDIDKILKKYYLEEFDEYALLKRSGAKLPIDSLEFIDPILDYNETPLRRIFYLAGPRYYIGCDGNNCEASIEVLEGEELLLELEPDNVMDCNAIKILNKNNIHLGYVPRFYSEGITELLKNEIKYSCKAFEVTKENNCNECIRIELIFDK